MNTSEVTLAALEPQRERDRVGEVARIGGRELFVGHRRFLPRRAMNLVAQAI
jgi:hypothetical protein